MSTVGYITNAAADSGVGIHAGELKRAVRKLKSHSFTLEEYMVDGSKGELRHNNDSVATIKPWPGPFGVKSVNWIRLGKYIKGTTQNHPVDFYHMTNQTMSFLASTLRPSIVTVHDLIDILEPQTPMSHLFARYIYRGIPKADRLIAISKFTAQTIEHVYGISQDTITVIPNGVSKGFHPIPDFKKTIGYQTLVHDLHIPPDAPIVLYVGSDHARKNVITAVRAFAAIKKDHPHAIFIKVGAAGITAGREQLIKELSQLGLKDSVRLLEHVSQEYLIDLYNLADVFIYPSRYEGFGMPLLEAMACGVPVITSNVTAIPEVVGDAAIMHDPDDREAFANSLARILSDTVYANTWREKSLKRASQFSWETSARQLRDVYTSVV